MGAFLQLLPGGFAGAPYRATDGAAFCVAEGRGRISVDGEIIEWAQGEVFAVPGWHACRLEADTDAVLFSAYDKHVHDAHGPWREDRQDNGTS
ncbi:MAG: cupin domain-containing protein [Alphaproteobacteria bacterium]